MRREFTYPSVDGIHEIHAVEWLPQGEPRAVVQIVHGVAEYALRYDPLAQYLTEHGFVVCGEDHLGHGLTAQGGEYGYFGPENGWDLVARDVRRLRKLEGENHPGIPYIMLGHSMGSFLTRTYLIRWPGTVDAAVLSGTGQEAAPLVALGKGISGMIGTLRGRDYVSDLVYDLSMGSYNKHFQPNETSGDWLSRDADVVRAFGNDPLCSFKPTVTMFRDRAVIIIGIIAAVKMFGSSDAKETAKDSTYKEVKENAAEKELFSFSGIAISLILCCCKISLLA